MLMREFLSQVVNETCKPQTSKNIAKTIVLTAFSNLISLPFGRMSFVISHSKSKAKILENLEKIIYRTFKIGFLEEDYYHKNQLKKDYEQFLDSLSSEDKLKVLTLALQNSEKYLEFVDSYSCRRAA
jgi:hypothetical protein